MELKSQFYECITCFYMGKQSEEHQKWGECLAYYTEAFNKLNECIKKGKVSVGGRLNIDLLMQVILVCCVNMP